MEAVYLSFVIIKSGQSFGADIGYIKLWEKWGIAIWG